MGGANAPRRRLPHNQTDAPPSLSSVSKYTHTQSVVALTTTSHPPLTLQEGIVRLCFSSDHFSSRLASFSSRAMLQAGAERPLPAGRLWVPGMSPQAAPSARALEIARRREEMLGMLHGLPESEYELSLTDLVEKTNGNAGMAHPLPLPPPPPPPSERKEAGQPSPLGRPAVGGLSESGRQAEQQQAAKTERRGSSRRSGSLSGSGSGRSSFRSSSDSVLLNFYMPRSFTRSFTTPRASHHHAPSVPARAASAVVVPDDSNKRERDSDAVKCWPMPWDRRWRKSSRRDQAGESAAMLRASAAEEKV